MDLTETALKNIEDLVDESATAGRQGRARRSRSRRRSWPTAARPRTTAILAKTDNVPVRKAFAIPVFYYDQFMRQNGFYDRVDALLADPPFQNDPAVRDTQLAALRDGHADRARRPDLLGRAEGEARSRLPRA